jgi:hypothetical protein
MWPRVVEAMLGCWLLVSPFVFRHPVTEGAWWARDLGAGALVLLFALFSFWMPARMTHLLILAVAVWLAVPAFASSGPPPPALQNDLVLGVILAMLAILPNRAALPPRRLRARA